MAQLVESGSAGCRRASGMATTIRRVAHIEHRTGTGLSTLSTVMRTRMLAWFCGEDGAKNSLAACPVGITCSIMNRSPAGQANGGPCQYGTASGIAPGLDCMLLQRRFLGSWTGQQLQPPQGTLPMAALRRDSTA